MRVLLDECLPRPLMRDLPGHDVFTIPEMGWAGVKNGVLLRLIEPDFDVFVTIDGNMRYQQNPAALQIAFIVLTAVNNKPETLQPLMPQVLVPETRHFFSLIPFRRQNLPCGIPPFLLQ